MTFAGEDDKAEILRCLEGAKDRHLCFMGGV
jgi:hypothetical protein